MDKKIVLIDGHSILNRAFFGIPDLTNGEGLHTNAVYGFLNILFRILEEEKPDYLTVAFDVHAPTFRHKMYGDYKGTRKPMAEELRQQVPVVKEVLRSMGVVIVEQEGYEADDILGTLAARCEKEGLEVSLVSGDRDLLQLASGHIKIRIPKTKRTGTEMPLVHTLHEMEKEGVLVNAEALKSYGESLSGKIEELEQEIYKDAGEEFNINSPKQLGVILFDKLKMPYGKKTKTGYSTAADVLDKLAGEYPLVSKILEYRQLAKLKSTYADGLANYIDKDGRIRSTFHQTITATGRISSTEPNLQNIPIRMELGRQIRKVFIPREGCVLIDADYSQIELRVLAHMSGDKNLIDAYQKAQDIHRITASQVFHVPFEEVTSLQRRNAKAVNFGIVYGISSFGLSQDLSITKKEAAQYIESYFKTYPGVKQFLDRQVKEAKEQGYVATMFGRRRPVPELLSSNFLQRSFGERVAMNSPIQGTAADIIKIAMVRVSEALKAQGLRSKLILQVHDELLIETWEEEIGQVKEILKKEMETAANLSVQLEIDMKQGKDWHEAH